MKLAKTICFFATILFLQLISIYSYATDNNEYKFYANHHNNAITFTSIANCGWLSVSAACGLENNCEIGVNSFSIGGERNHDFKVLPLHSPDTPWSYQCQRKKCNFTVTTIDNEPSVHSIHYGESIAIPNKSIVSVATFD